MSDKSGGIDRKRARCLDSISQSKTQRRTQSHGALGNVGIEIDALPGVEHSPVTPGDSFVARPEWTGQHFAYRNGRDGKTQSPARVRFEQRHEMRPEPGMTFQEIDDRRGIDQKERLVRQIPNVYRSHSSRSLRTVEELFLPHIPRPDPASGISDC